MRHGPIDEKIFLAEVDIGERFGGGDVFVDAERRGIGDFYLFEDWGDASEIRDCEIRTEGDDGDGKEDENQREREEAEVGRKRGERGEQAFYDKEENGDAEEIGGEGEASLIIDLGEGEDMEKDKNQGSNKVVLFPF